MQCTAGPLTSSAAHPLGMLGIVVSDLALFPPALQRPVHSVAPIPLSGRHGPTDTPDFARPSQSPRPTWRCAPNSLDPVFAFLPALPSSIAGPGRGAPHPAFRRTRSRVTTETALPRSPSALEVKGHLTQFRFRFRNPLVVRKLWGLGDPSGPVFGVRGSLNDFCCSHGGLYRGRKAENPQSGQGRL